MKASDYIVEFLISREVKHVFGYPGGMVTHLMESFHKYENQIKAHVSYHEQASAFEACAYAQASENLGVAYATSGPGATNLITGICNAYFDSIPVLFITGQVNVDESKSDFSIRQRGFQETDIVSMAKYVTKYSAYIKNSNELRYHLEKAAELALEGRKGPVLLDIPMNIQREEIDPGTMKKFTSKLGKQNSDIPLEKIAKNAASSSRPCIYIGAALKENSVRDKFISIADQLQIPVVSSMLAVDVLPHDRQYYYGFAGAYGERTANFILAKSDLILALGTRLDVRQVGGKRDMFAPNANLIRVDLDSGELSYKVKSDEMQICADVMDVIRILPAIFPLSKDCYQDWKNVCSQIKCTLQGMDNKIPNDIIRTISRQIPDNRVITTDVGQNQVWVAQSFYNKRSQKILFSGGHGAMGYSLPAAIGAFYGSGMPAVSFNGDGGFQMNIQELQFIARECLPIKIIILNNHALGMIRHFQEMYFDHNYTQTVEDGGYTTPEFKKIADAYGMDYYSVYSKEEIQPDMFCDLNPAIIEVKLPRDTWVFPKLEFGKPNQDQEPLIDRKEYQYLMNL